MKKKYAVWPRLLMVLSFTGLFSCQADYNEIEELSPQSEFAYAKIYKTYRGFYFSDLNMEGYMDEYRSEYYQQEHSRDIGKKITGYVDARRSDGYSTWSSPMFAFTFDREKTASLTTEPVVHSHYFSSNITMSSPPAHLHLVLNNLMEESSTGKIPQKTWKVVSVTDESGKSLADDPDWTNYTDNSMTFRKAVDFMYIPGAKRSKTELDLFGTVQQHSTFLYGTYTVKEDASKKVILTLSFPTFPQQLEVVESSWTSLTLKGTIAGKTGLATFVPAN